MSVPVLDLSTRQAPSTGWLQRRARFLIPLCILGLLTPYASRLLIDANGKIAWAIDLASHWQWLYAAGLAVCALVAAIGSRKWLLCLLAVPLPLFSASALLPPANAGGSVLAVASANVNLDNSNVEPLARWLAQERPDVVVVLEVSPDYAAGLEKLVDYPHRMIAADYGPFGIALLSRKPLIDAKIVRDAEDIAHIEAQIDLDGQRVGVTAFHPMPPLRPEYHAARNNKLKAFALATRANGIPFIVAGDMNATPWSSAFIGIEQFGWRRATGLAPTWPASGRGWIGIPIDHVVASPEWALVSNAIGRNIGSDHFPVVARFSMAAR